MLPNIKFIIAAICVILLLGFLLNSKEKQKLQGKRKTILYKILLAVSLSSFNISRQQYRGLPIFLRQEQSPKCSRRWGQKINKYNSRRTFLLLVVSSIAPPTPPSPTCSAPPLPPPQHISCDQTALSGQPIVKSIGIFFLPIALIWSLTVLHSVNWWHLAWNWHFTIATSMPSVLFWFQERSCQLHGRSLVWLCSHLR